MCEIFFLWGDLWGLGSIFYVKNICLNIGGFSNVYILLSSSSQSSFSSSRSSSPHTSSSGSLNSSSTSSVSDSSSSTLSQSSATAPSNSGSVAATSHHVSDIWKAFTKVPNKDQASCNTCAGTLAYRSRTGTKALWNHLKRHPLVLKDLVFTDFSS